MSAKKDDKPREYTKEEIAYAWSQCPSLLSKSITSLFNDEKNGGVFYTHIILSMMRDFTNEVPTAAVSVTDKITLYINPVFWVHELKTVEQRREILRHEVLHIVLQHCLRGKDFGNKQLANIAADLVVNSYLDQNALGKEFITRFVFPQNFKLPPEESLPFYYENYPLKDNPICMTPTACDKKYREGSPESGDGDADHAHHDHAIGPDGKCKVCGGIRPVDSHEPWSSDEADKISDSLKDSLIKDAISRAADAAQKSAGNLPSFVKKAIEMAKKKAEIPWTHILRQFVAKASVTSLKSTRKKFSKRIKDVFGNPVRPGVKINQLKTIIVSIDVSGSISDEEYLMAMNETFNIFKADSIAEVDALEWDAAITSKDKKGKPGPIRITRSHKVVRTGSGGTCPDQALDWVNKNKAKFSAQIVFTDGYFFGKTVKPQIPTIWVLTSGGTDEYLKGEHVIKLPKKKGD